MDVLKIIICCLSMLVPDRNSKNAGNIRDTVMSGVYQGLGELYVVIKDDKVFGFYQSYRQTNFATIFFIKGTLEN